MRVMIAAGGTGGHIYPGIAVAKEIVQRAPDSIVRFIGTAKGLEKKLVPEAGFELSLIKSSGLKNVGLMGKIRGALIMPQSFFEAWKLIKDFRPDVVIGAGGYVSGPVVLMAYFMGVPAMVMESNALPGFTNRKLARFVDKAALTFPEAEKFFPGKGVITGNPVRKEFFEIEPKQREENNFHLLIFGGSQGSRAINTAMVEALRFLDGRLEKMRVTHQTGESQFATVSKDYAEAGWQGTEVRPYITDMMSAFAESDLIICRAGATTCAELAAAGKASIMVPLPSAADDHQRKNAEALEAAGAAKMILQADLSGERLANEIKAFIDAPEKVSEMEQAARKLAKADAAKITVDLIEQLAAKNKK
jgi:UDP-N-acetylglucosamine--N-acetylmuramyl-(pentapeptide) pyrophosphoryl-undecaprenol N-acetylglucosamine transferase